MLTVLFGVGQVVGPIVAASLAGERGNFRQALPFATPAIVVGTLLVLAAMGVSMNSPFLSNRSRVG